MVCKVLRQLILLIILFPFVLSAQTKTLVSGVEKLTVEEGLSQGMVYCIYQDNKGFMWFGTKDGLNRYDGYDFKTYRHEPSELYSLPHEPVTGVFEDSRGLMWVGTKNHLNLFHRRTEHVE